MAVVAKDKRIAYISTLTERERTMEEQVVKIVSWLGGEHWYVGHLHFLRLEEAIAYCELWGLAYEVIRDPRHFYARDGE